MATPHDDWDAGDMSCGDLVLELFLRMKRLPPHTVLRVRATDAAAPLDIPAWCSMTGHVLLSAIPPIYLLQTKEG
ncbi:MAG: sulfurtransferase TusA family protein [Myxococcales bacterium]|nr:sulfurtransferase TusA family protein [Myxococcales bacterium]